MRSRFASTVFYVTITGISLFCQSYQGAVELLMCPLPPPLHRIYSDSGRLSYTGHTTDCVLLYCKWRWPHLYLSDAD